ncbi:hypothetical protein EMCG_05066 [[Emmonsia] crescens]|uniref:Uncharacterized protein n=1 Tax=[Emmonsia] crescens TaxID=73230 RepID=A0A0G2IY02_9EURO|nr:hypothetical protein EMCG_05066 [Emmonsia crescens UAMH 3008]
MTAHHGSIKITHRNLDGERHHKYLVPQSVTFGKTQQMAPAPSISNANNHQRNTTDASTQTKRMSLDLESELHTLRKKLHMMNVIVRDEAATRAKCMAIINEMEDELTLLQSRGQEHKEG